MAEDARQLVLGAIIHTDYAGTLLASLERATDTKLFIVAMVAELIARSKEYRDAYDIDLREPQLKYASVLLGCIQTTVRQRNW